MNKSKIRTLILAIAFTVSVSSVSLFTTTNVFAAQAATSQRLWGNDRYKTAVAVSKSGFTTSDTVILVRGDDFADALAVTPLAKMYNAPILLTKVDSLPSSVQAEITRLGAKKIVIAGGIGAVSQAVENSLKKLATVERIGGNDRYVTSVMVAEKLGAKTSVALATGLNFADAESIAAVAAQMGMPVIFTAKNTLSATAKKYISDNKVTKTYLVGGNDVISDSVASAVPGMERLSGANRYGTNLAVLNKFSNQINFDGVFVATGADFPDALTASALAAKNSEAVVLASKSLTAATVSFIKDQITPKTIVTLVGGEKVTHSAITTSLALDKTDYATDGKTYSAADITSKNINLIGKDITVDGATINGNLYVYGNGTVLSNATVTGTIFLDPGLTGDVTLKNVKASKIVVQSGAASSINLDSVTAAVLVSQSNNSNPSTRIHTTGNTAIGTTNVQSDIFLDCKAGSFGFVSVIPGGTSNKNLELAGTFTPIHLTTPCNFTGTARPTVYVDAPGVIISGNVGDLVINTTTAPQFAPGTVIGRIIGTESFKGITLTIPAGVTVTQATSDFVLAGAGASSVVVIPPTTVEDTTPPVIIPGGGGIYVPPTETTYNVAISHGALSIVQSYSDITISTLYDKNTAYLKSLAGSTYNTLITEKVNSEFTRLQGIKVATAPGGTFLEYATTKLLANDPNSTLATALQTYNSGNSSSIISYFENATFADLLNYFNLVTGGDTTIPELYGTNQIFVTINNGTPKSSGDTIDLVTEETTLGLTPNTKLSELKTKNFDIKIVHGKIANLGTTYELKAVNGTLTISTPVGGTYTLTIQ